MKKRYNQYAGLDRVCHMSSTMGWVDERARVYPSRLERSSSTASTVHSPTE
jgi:hypothetical protein